MSFRERVEQARVSLVNKEQVAANDNNETEDIIKSDYFGVENIRNLPACLDLRFADGTRKAVPYSYILEIDYNPSGEIKITCSEKEVVIKGRDLERLYDYLAAYRVRFVGVCLGSSNEEAGSVITAIEINDI